MKSEEIIEESEIPALETQIKEEAAYIRGLIWGANMCPILKASMYKLVDELEAEIKNRIKALKNIEDAVYFISAKNSEIKYFGEE